MVQENRNPPRPDEQCVLNFMNTRCTDSIDEPWLKEAALLWDTLNGTSARPAGRDTPSGLSYSAFEVMNPSCLPPFQRKAPSIRIVRREYTQLWEETKFLMAARHDADHHMPQALVVWGQPGVGKSAFLYYALAKAMEEKRPTIFCRGSKEAFILAYGKIGVFSLDDVYKKAQLPKHTLVLVDSNYLLEKVPEAFLGDDPTDHTFWVLATSPKISRWKTPAKYSLATIHVMPLWSREEVLQASTDDGYPKKPGYTTPLQLYDLSGPSARSCFVGELYGPMNIEQFIHEKIDMVREILLESKDLRYALTHRVEHDVKQGHRFHSLFFASPLSLARSSYQKDPDFQYIIGSSFLRACVRIAMDRLEDNERANVLTTFVPLPSLAGSVFGSLMHRIMTDGCSATFSATYANSVQSLPRNLSPSYLPFDTFKDFVAEDNRLYVPSVGYPTLDAFFVSLESGKRVITCLLATIARKHTIAREDIADIIERFPDWEVRFVFVVLESATGHHLALSGDTNKGVWRFIVNRKKVAVQVGWAVLPLDGSSKPGFPPPSILDDYFKAEEFYNDEVTDEEMGDEEEADEE